MELNEYGKPGVYKEEVQTQEEENKKKGKIQEHEEAYPGCVQNLKHYLWEFCSRTTVHGFNYLGERGRTIPERIWWLVTIVGALYLCTTLIIKTYDKWVNSPVIVTFATSQTPIWKIPFPAVTICSEVKSTRSRFNYTDIYLRKKIKREVTDKEAKEFEYMSLVCNTPPSLLNNKVTTTDERAMDFLAEVSPDINKTMFQVFWKGRQYNEITDLFTPILTSEGLCYTFNTLDRKEIFTDIVENYKDYFSTKGKDSDWSMESGYPDDIEIDASYPRRTTIAGLKGGLRVLFKVPHEDLDYACGDTNIQGFKIIIHHPAELPRGKQKYFRVPLGQSVLASVKPNMMTTAEGLHGYKPEDRRCYFTKEKALKFYKLYNQQNCLNECLADFTLETCGCVAFHMQREKLTPICSAGKQKCVVNARAIYLVNEVKKQRLNEIRKGVKTTAKDSELTDKCNCLPSCNTLDFEVETSQADWDLKDFLEIQRQAGDWLPDTDGRLVDEFHFAKLVMYFKDMQFITSERNELYGQTDFWASCGGLMGLFTGFSFLSAIEIVYYLTLRFICNIYLFGSHYWSGTEELLENKRKREENKAA